MMQRGFVNCGGRYTHWRAVGTGPVIVLLHESPRSSTSLIPLMTTLSDQFCCIALDTPGYGASDPLPERFAPIEAFANETLKALSLLGVETFQLYGTHTGAAIACEVAQRAPSRVRSLLLDGLAMFTPEEQGPLVEKYLLPQEPTWDGSHLMRIWSRIRDQALFFPFYDRSPAARLATPTHDLDFMLRSCLGFIESGDVYRDGYKAALTYDARVRMMSLPMPGRLHVAAGDLIASHLPRAEGLALDVIQTPLERGLWLEETRQWFARHHSPRRSADDFPQDDARRFFKVGHHLVYAARGAGSGIALNALVPQPRANGLYGPPQQPGAAAWFCDPPGFGTNAASHYDPAALETAAGLPVKSVCEDAPRFTCAPPDFTGQFLMASWYVMRDSALFGNWKRLDQPCPTQARPDLEALRAGQLALLYGVCGQPL